MSKKTGKPFNRHIQVSSIEITDINTETLTGAKILSLYADQVQFLDPGGAGRTVTLPSVSNSRGLSFEIWNRADAAEVITVEDADANTIATVAQNEGALVRCDGTNWVGLVGANT